MSLTKTEKLSHYGVMIIAISALFVSLWQGYSIEKHNKLSVKPYLDYLIDQSDSIKTITFNNAGLGPAIIKEFKYKFKGKTYKSMNNVLKAADLLKNTTGLYNFGENTIIAPGESKLLVRFEGLKRQEIYIELVFESIYEERFNLNFSF